VAVVGRRIEPGREVALGAEAVAGRPKPAGVRLVTVRARDPRAEHPALEERAVLVHFAENLAVGVVQAGAEERRRVGVEERTAVGIGVDDRPAAGVAAGARVHLGR